MRLENVIVAAGYVVGLLATIGVSASSAIGTDELPAIEQRAAAIKAVRAAGGNVWPDMNKLLAAGVRQDFFNPQRSFKTANLEGVSFDDGVVVALAAFPELETLILSKSSVTDEQLARLPLRNLQDLELEDTRISDNGLERLRGLKNLRSLSLAHTAVTGEGLAPLVTLEHLQSLHLSNTAVGDEGMDHLARLPNLAELGLGYTKIGDVGLEKLCRSMSLVDLDLRETHVTDAGMPHLAMLARLTALDASGTRISDAGIQKIAGLTAMSRLSLANTETGDESAAVIGRWANMEILVLSGTKITDQGVKQLARLRKLVYLNLSRTPITDLALVVAGRFGKLEILNLADTAISDTGLAQLEPLAELEHLDVSGTLISDPRLEALKPLLHLKTVDVRRTKVTNLDLFRGFPRTNANVQKTLAALDEETEFAFGQQPLCDVIDYIKARHNIEIQFDNRSVNAAGVDVIKTGITSNQGGITLREALTAILNPLGLTFALRHEVLLIAAKPLGGPILDLPVQPAGQRLSPKLAEALMQPSELDCQEEPLARVVEQLAQKHGIKMVLDPESLADARIATDVPITRTVKGITLKSCLELLLFDLDLTCVAEGDRLIIRARADKADRAKIK